MSNQITAAGIEIETYAEIVSNIVNGTADTPGMIQIYGSDINVASNSPDGQMINIYALSKTDMLNLCVAIYDSMDPDQAVGVALDRIAQIAGLYRKAGVYTEVDVNVVVSTGLNLNGLDTSTPYTIQDSNGNQFNLITSASLTSGTNSLAFRAASIGFIQVLANSLTTPVTIVAGVTSVNNPSTPYQVGSNQETDANFRLRRQASTAFPSQGPLNALYAGLNSLSGVAQAVVYENTTNAVDSDGIPAHGIWVVTDGGTAEQIGETIYAYRNLGVPMKGSETYVVTQVDGSTITMSYDTVVDQDLWLQATLVSISGASIDTDAIKEGLVANYLFGINEPADISTLTQQIRAINPDVVCSGLGVSDDDITYVDLLSPTTKQNKFVLDTARITLS